MMVIALAGPTLAAPTDDQLIARVGKAIVRNGLVANLRCVSFAITRKVHPQIDQVEVRERHGGTCGGDPGTAPRLFDVIVDRTNGQMATDAADPADGGMARLR